MHKYFLTVLIYLLTIIDSGSLRGQTANPSFDRHIENTEPSEPTLSFPDVPGQPPHEFNAMFSRSEKETDDFHTKFTNMLGILALLISFMLLASWMIKKMMKTRVTELNTQSSIRVLETRFISPKSTLYLLEVMGQGLLIAESSSGVHQISKIRLPSDEAGYQELPAEELEPIPLK